MMTKVTFVNFFIKTYSILSIQYMYKISCKMDKNVLRYSMFFHRGSTSFPALRFSKKTSPSKVNQIKCHKNHFFYLKLILLLSGDLSSNPDPIQNDHLKENWKTFRSRGVYFIHWNINSFLTKIDELREIVTPNGY